MRAYGINQNLCAWFEDFLFKKCQRVTVNNCFSDWLLCINGIPQGRVLEPTLFHIDINDLPDCVHHSDILLCADDASAAPFTISTRCRLNFKLVWTIAVKTKCVKMHIRSNQIKSFICIVQDKYWHIINSPVRLNILSLKAACKFKWFQFHNKTMSSLQLTMSFCKKFQTLTVLKA